VHNLEPEDLVALTIEAAAMARVPLAGTGLDSGQGSVLTGASQGRRPISLGISSRRLIDIKEVRTSKGNI
jgi:hypothetical protein